MIYRTQHGHANASCVTESDVKGPNEFGKRRSYLHTVECDRQCLTHILQIQVNSLKVEIVVEINDVCMVKADSGKTLQVGILDYNSACVANAGAKVQGA